MFSFLKPRHKVVVMPENNSSHPQYRLGRHVHFDKRSKKHRIRVDHAAPLVNKTWERKIQPLQQGQLGSCTCNGVVGCIATAPYDQDGIADDISFDEPLAVRLYELATQLDQIPSAYPPDDTGSTVIAALQAAQKLGLIAGYTWCMGLDDVLQTLSYYGPVVVGIGWYDNFFTPDANGQIHIGGTVVGGHAFEIHAIDVDRKIVWAVNSWGPEYGISGKFCISWDDLNTLLNDNGEAAHILMPGSPLLKQPSMMTNIVNYTKSLFKKILPGE